MPPTNPDEGISFAAELGSGTRTWESSCSASTPSLVYAMAPFNAGSERRAYLLKERLKDQAELSRALHNVAAGGSLVDSTSGREARVRTPARRLGVLRSSRLRELKMLGLIAEGRSNGWIADEPRDHEASGRAAHQRDLSQAGPREAGGRQPGVKAALVYLSGDAPSTASNRA